MEGISVTQKKFSRRSFMQGAALAVAGAAAAGMSGLANDQQAFAADAGSNTPVGLPETWDYEADIVVVGYGGAGAIAAITAADLGSSVFLIEKYPNDTETEIRHTPSSRAAGAALLICWNKEDGAKAMRAHTMGLTDQEVCDAWAEKAARHIDYVRLLGFNYSQPQNPAEGGRLSEGEYPMLFGGANDILSSGSVPGNGSGFMQVARKNIAERSDKISVLWETEGKRLIRNEETREICGVSCLTADGREITVKAKKAVALTTGGFGQNEDMKKNYLRGYPAHFYACTNATGDGIKMGQAVGAELVHMTNCQGAGITYHPDWGRGASFSNNNASIFVGKRGQRFWYEMGGPSHGTWFEFCKVDPKTGDFPNNPSWRIFGADAKWPLIATREKGFLDGTDTSQDWAPTSEEIVDKDLMVSKGWVGFAETVEAMAAEILKDPENEGKMDVENLKKTLEDYNRYVVEGSDPEFGRPPNTLQAVNPPYYWLKNYPGGAATQGGLKKNGKGQVVDPFGEPIPRLYVAGENGNAWACFYPRAGTNTSDNVAFGWIIGEEMSALEPWE
jgi:succinate dehydrogenase/fumarate reductase flavoprotein subunit